MELVEVFYLFFVILCHVLKIEPMYSQNDANLNIGSQNARSSIGGAQLRFVAIVRSRPLVLQSIIVRSKKKTEDEDKMFFAAGVDKIDYYTCLGRKAMFAPTKEKSLRLGKPGRTKTALIKELAEVLGIPRDRLAEVIERLLEDLDEFDHTDLTTKDDNCDKLVTVVCDTGSRYRTADGSCNNLNKPIWGRAFIPMRRFVKPVYQDGVSDPKTLSVVTSPDGQTRFPLPSARLVSRTVHETNEGTSLNSVTHLLMQWGQFTDHDTTSTPEQEGIEGSVPTCCIDDVSESSKSKINMDPSERDICFPIQIPPGDAHFRRSCFSFVRSIQVSNSDCRSVPVEQLNQITAYIDGSQIYGSSLKEQHALRTFRGGLLKTSANDLLPADDKPSCVLNRKTDYCFKAGDRRVNEQMALASMHTIWMREHNRIAKELARFHPDLDDEALFQETRKLVGAMLQHITFSEFLPLVLGPQTMKIYKLLLSNDYSLDYNSNIDPSIRNAFATAAYRFGHSLIQSTMSQYDVNYNRIDGFQLKTSFGNTSHILRNAGDGVNTYIRGLLMDNVRKVDRYLTDQVTNHLFEDPEGNSLDLAALNIQRGRDHGLPGYNEFRKFCRLNTVTSFGNMVDHPVDARNRFRLVYRHVDDIDLFSGGVSENRVPGGLVGPTFSCIIANQFRALKDGDRFWFNRDLGDLGFRPDQLRQIRRVRLSRVICDNTDTTYIQRLAFRTVSQYNPRLNCEDPSLPKLDLSRWMDGSPRQRDLYGAWSQWSACVGGKRYRARQCLGGASCSGSSEEMERCSSVGIWNEWGQWTACINGVQSRDRTCQGTGCKGNNIQRWKCTSGSWGEWGQWSSCVNEVQSRSRSCIGTKCDGQDVQRWKCSSTTWGYGTWAEWGQWSACINEVQTRYRTCKGTQCGGHNVQRWKCSPSIWGSGYWAEWGQWSACINEVQSRSRTCIGTQCNGNGVQRWKCSVDTGGSGSWEEWGQWSACINEVQTRYRTCDGNHCNGKDVQRWKCTVQPWTPGVWGDWGQWSSCRNQIQERIRTCWGASCPGDRTQRWKCSSDTGTWASWLNWSTCLKGKEYRARRCNGGACNGYRSESRKCPTEREHVPIYCSSSVYRKYASKFCPND